MTLFSDKSFCSKILSLPCKKKRFLHNPVLNEIVETYNNVACTFTSRQASRGTQRTATSTAPAPSDAVVGVVRPRPETSNGGVIDGENRPCVRQERFSVHLKDVHHRKSRGGGVNAGGRTLRRRWGKRRARQTPVWPWARSSGTECGDGVRACVGLCQSRLHFLPWHTLHLRCVRMNDPSNMNDP